MCFENLFLGCGCVLWGGWGRVVFLLFTLLLLAGLSYFFLCYFIITLLFERACGERWCGVCEMI